MIKVALRVYNRDIETLIDQGHTEEAVSHCMHILKSFPKHLETYRLLGKAYLEAHQYTEAADIFTRVLLAVPDDFVSHLGMSIIYDEKHDLTGAIWHMERAFEINSTNGGIQNELRRLYGRRDGVEPARIHLTRGALAQIYTKAGEFQQAIAEIKSLLADDPTRTDMKSLLAKAYFQSGMKNEAVESCTELLKTYIYNLEANKILAAILLGTTLAKELEQVQQRVHALDPYTAAAAPPFFNTMSVPDGAVMLEKMEWIPGKHTNEKWNISSDVHHTSSPGVDEASKAGPVRVETNPNFEKTTISDSTELPEWLKSVNSSAETSITAQDGENPDLSWLETPQDAESESQPFVDSAETQENAVMPAAEEITASEPSEINIDGIKPVTEVLAVDVIPEAETGEQQLADELPGPLKNAEETELVSPELPSSQEVISSDEEQQTVVDSDLNENQAEPVEIPVQQDGLQFDETGANREDDWFTGTQDDADGLTLPTVPKDAGSDDDWFTNLESNVENPILENSSGIPAAAEEIPDWLQELEAKTNTIESVSIPSEDKSEITASQDIFAESSANAPDASREVNPNLPEWLQDLEFGPSEQKQTSESDGLNSTPEIPIDPVTSDSRSETSDIPDWLQGLDFSSKEDEEPADGISTGQKDVSGQISDLFSDDTDSQDEFIPDISLVLGDNIPSPDAVEENIPSYPNQTVKPGTGEIETETGEIESDTPNWLDDLMRDAPSSKSSTTEEEIQDTNNADQALAWLDSLDQTDSSPEESNFEQNQPAADLNNVKSGLKFDEQAGPFTENTPEISQDEEKTEQNDYPSWMKIAADEPQNEPIIPVDSDIAAETAIPEAIEPAEETRPASNLQEAASEVSAPELGQETQAETLSWLESLVQQDETNPVDLINAATVTPAAVQDSAGKKEVINPTETGEEIDPKDIPAELMETKPTIIRKLTQSSLVEPVSTETTSNSIPDWAKDIVPVMDNQQELAGNSPADDENFDWLGDLSKPQDTGLIEENSHQQTVNHLSVDGKELPEPPQISLDWVQGYSPHMNPAETGLAVDSPVQQEEIGSVAGLLQPEAGEISTPDFILSEGDDNLLEHIVPDEIPHPEDSKENSETETPSSENPDASFNLQEVVPPEINELPGITGIEQAPPNPVDESAERTRAWLDSLGPEAEPVSFTPLPWVPAEIDSDEGITDETTAETEENPSLPIDESSDWYETLKSTSSGKEAEPFEWSNPKNEQELFSDGEPRDIQSGDKVENADSFAVENNQPPAEETGDYFTISSPSAGDFISSDPLINSNPMSQDIPGDAIVIPADRSSNEPVDIFETGNPDSPISFVEDEIPEAAADTVDKSTPEITPEVETQAVSTASSPVDKDRQTLEKAREMLVRGKPAEAANEYSRLIKKAKLLDEIIYDLQQAVYRQPADILTWQTLGDAYFRANKLQEALDAYGKAEGLLR